jgi:hypothetical protein
MISQIDGSITVKVFIIIALNGSNPAYRNQMLQSIALIDSPGSYSGSNTQTPVDRNIRLSGYIFPGILEIASCVMEHMHMGIGEISLKALGTAW